MSARPSLPTKAAALFGFSDILHIETFSTNESNINFWHVGIRHTDSLPKTGPDTLNPRPPLDAPVSRLPGDLRCWVAGLSRTRRRTRFDRDGRWCSGRRTQWQEWSARIGRVVPAVGIWSPCRIRGCERRPAPAPRSGDALDCRRQSGAEERREGREPRPLCYLPDGRGRHPTANVPRDFAAHRGTAAAVTTSASVRRSMSCIQEQPTAGVRPNARENGRIRPSTKRSDYPRCWERSAPRVWSCKRAGKTRTLMPVWDSSGEYRVISCSCVNF